MRGLERSKQFYLTTILPDLKAEFPSFYDQIAIGKIGKGSDCYGFDDEVSEDHDFSLGCQFYLTQAQDLEFGFKLTRFYSQFEKNKGARSFYKERREGVFSIAEILSQLTGLSHEPQSITEWLQIPEYALYEVTNGEIFNPGNGEFVKLLNTYKTGLPKDVLKKRLAKHLILASQSGEYNYKRILSHGEKAAASFALFEFVDNASYILFELNNKPTPYYKWRFRSARTLMVCSKVLPLLEALLLDEKCDKIALIASITNSFCLELFKSGYTQTLCTSLEEASFQTQSGIENQQLRKTHIMED